VRFAAESKGRKAPPSRTGSMTTRAALFTPQEPFGHLHVSRCVGYEFQDVVISIDDVYAFAPISNRQEQLKDTFRAISRALGMHTQHISKYIQRTRLYKSLGAKLPSELEIPSCELFVCHVLYAHEILKLEKNKYWRKNSNFAACWVEELWCQDISDLKIEIEVLKDFDHVFCSCAGTIETLAERIRIPVTYLPPAVDAIRFCPWPNPRPRSIDVCNVGRRSVITHESLLKYARERRLFYYHDTTKDPFVVASPIDHRILYSNLLRTSRYFIANRAKFNCFAETAGQQEIGYRFFEGLAAGAILLGDPPNTDAFYDQLGWQDSVIPISVDCPHISDVLGRLDKDLLRLEEIRRRNVINVLARHDWLHRWSVILDTFGLPHTQAMANRQRQLDDLRAHIEGTPGFVRANWLEPGTGDR
jgi:hypothetical protein